MAVGVVLARMECQQLELLHAKAVMVSLLQFQAHQLPMLAVVGEEGILAHLLQQLAQLEAQVVQVVEVQVAHLLFQLLDQQILVVAAVVLDTLNK